MKYIQKNTEPDDFSKWREQAIERGEISFDRREPKHNWAELKATMPENLIEGVHYYTNQQLWAELLKEQGHICAYCGRKLKNKVRIDHLNPKAIYKNQVLDYNNLLAVCDGGEGSKNEHCDVKKKSFEIKIQPTQATCEDQFSYIEGKILGIDANADDTIEKLGLDAIHLEEGRKNISKEVAQTQIEEWLNFLGDDIETIRHLKKQRIEEIYSKPALDEFCFVEVFYLRTFPI